MEDQYVVLDTKLGKIKGQAMQSVLSGKTFYSFKGIPYGKPPIGHLRFKDPEPFGAWEGIRDALQDGNSCVQKKPDYMVADEAKSGGVSTLMMGDEDCLFLNVYMSKLPTAALDGAKEPVMLFIHGGGFIGGSGSSKNCGPDFLMEGNVVFVSINYRCGPFGFLSLENEEVPGNAGLKDQTLALRWVQDNISSFGGDPSNVTIFGVSAGAASVHYHLLSPLSRGLFHKAIIQSGCAFNFWALQEEPLKNSIKLAAELGCTSEEPSDVLRLLQAAPTEDLILSQERLGQDPSFLLGLVFSPCVEVRVQQAFLPDLPETLMAAGQFQKVPVMLGITQNEGSVAIMFDKMNEEKFELHNTNPTRFAGRILPSLKHREEANTYREEIVQFYTKGLPVCWDNVNEYMKFLGDIIVNVGMSDLREALVRSSSPEPVYSYLFANHRRCPCQLLKVLFPDVELYKRLLTSETCHACDVFFLFTIALGDNVKTTNITEQDKIAIMQVIKAWTNFAATGNPNGKDTEELWEEDTANNPCYMEIAEPWTMRKRIPLENRINFWKQLAAQGSIP